MKLDVTKVSEAIIELERSLNERWSIGDCDGYLDTYSEDICYFDPLTEKLLVGRSAVAAHIRSLYKNPQIIRNEYLNSHVIVSEAGDLAVLSYNLRTFVADEKEGAKLLRAWNSTEVYRLGGGEWRIVHSNWALTQSLGFGLLAS
jgi:ketosteroid isomerase-like protein